VKLSLLVCANMSLKGMSQTTSVLVNVTDTLCTRMLVVDFDRGFLGSVEREIAEPYTEGSPHNLAWIKAAFEPGQEHRVFKTASDLSIPVQLIEELRRLESKGELGHAGEQGATTSIHHQKTQHVTLLSNIISDYL